MRLERTLVKRLAERQNYNVSQTVDQPRNATRNLLLALPVAKKNRNRGRGRNPGQGRENAWQRVLSIGASAGEITEKIQRPKEDATKLMHVVRWLVPASVVHAKKAGPAQGETLIAEE